MCRRTKGPFDGTHGTASDGCEVRVSCLLRHQRCGPFSFLFGRSMKFQGLFTLYEPVSMWMFGTTDVFGTTSSVSFRDSSFLPSRPGRRDPLTSSYFLGIHRRRLEYQATAVTDPTLPSGRSGPSVPGRYPESPSCLRRAVVVVITRSVHGPGPGTSGPLREPTVTGVSVG